MKPQAKKYDERYFRRWYHTPGSRIVSAAARERRIRFVVAASEFLLGRRLRTVLDVGCGEAPWQPTLRRMRPCLRYVGIDSSEYAVRRFGRRRGILLGSFGELAKVAPDEPFDLVLSSDMIHYLHKAELERGIGALATRVGGVAYLDFFTSRDEIEGDMRDMKLRAPRYYQDLLASVRLHPVGLLLHARHTIIGGLSSMERRC